MPDPAIRLLDYQRAMFVGRTKELERIAAVAHAVAKGAKGEEPSQRVFIVTGPRGSGKTWLLRFLAEAQLSDIHPMRIWSLNLADYTHWATTRAVEDILHQLRQQVLGRNGSLTGSLSDISRGVIAELRESLQHESLAVLIDHVYESDTTLLKNLEQYLVEPLALEPRVLLVLAGRGNPYPWRTYQLKLSAIPLELEPFDEVLAREQLRRQAPHLHDNLEAIIADIMASSGGIPLAVYLRAMCGDSKQAWDMMVDSILDPVNVDERRGIRQYVEALCVLRAFDEGRIPTMLATYHHNPAMKDWNYAQATKVREQIARWSFARWDAKNRSGHLLDPTLRRFAELYLYESDREKWKALHYAAGCMYREWVTRYPGAKQRWQDEADYHTARLEEAGYSIATCPDETTERPPVAAAAPAMPSAMPTPG